MHPSSLPADGPQRLCVGTVHIPRQHLLLGGHGLAVEHRDLGQEVHNVKTDVHALNGGASESVLEGGKKSKCNPHS